MLKQESYDNRPVKFAKYDVREQILSFHFKIKASLRTLWNQEIQ